MVADTGPQHNGTRDPPELAKNELRRGRAYRREVWIYEELGRRCGHGG